MPRRIVTITTTVLAGGVFFHALGRGTPAGGDARHPVAAEQTLATGTGEGPWSASCKYWAPARSAPLISATDAGKRAQTTAADRPGNAVADLSCAGTTDHWGIPESLPSGAKPRITTVIATVPDPIHSHMALEFDRVMDAYTLAAADSGYLTSYSWLPWDSSDRVVAKDAEGQKQTFTTTSSKQQWPGLMILKHVAATTPSGGKGDSIPVREQNFDEVIYAFLVGESPALGINGVQLNNAIALDLELTRRFGVEPGAGTDPDSNIVCQSWSGDVGGASPQGGEATPERCLAFIGPTFSGSAASLREGIAQALTGKMVEPGGKVRVAIAGSTSTDLAKNVLNRPLRGATEAQYISFGEDGDFEEAEFEHMVALSSTLNAANMRPESLAVLTEEGTAFGYASDIGQVNAERMREASAKKHPRPQTPVQAVTQDPLAALPRTKPITILFPRGIATLRNSAASDQKAAAAASQDPTGSPYLPFTLTDTSLDDSAVRFGGDNTAISQEAELIAIARQIQQAGVKYVEIGASSILDTMFLARFLHRACPDVRLVFLGADLLSEHGADNGSYVGAISISPYSLTRPVYLNGKGETLHSFAGSRSVAAYNSALYIFRSATGNANQGLIDNQSVAERIRGHHPLLWATAVGYDGYYPLGIVQDLVTKHPLDRERICPGSNCDPVRTREALQPYLDSGLSSSPSLLWYAISIVVALLCVWHSAAMLSATFWSASTGDLCVDNNDQPFRRSMYLNIGTAMLCSMAFSVACPAFAARRQFHLPWESMVMSATTLLLACVALGVTVSRTARYFVAGWSWRSAETKTLYTILNLVALATLIVEPLIWARACLHDLVEGQMRYVGLFFSYRCLHPESGISPLLPVTLLLFGWFLWAVFQTLRLRFSWNVRPIMPGTLVVAPGAYHLYVPDDALTGTQDTGDSLYQRATCLLITRHLLGSVTQHYPGREALLTLTYFCLYGVAVFVIGVSSIEGFLLAPRGLPTAFEFLIASLFFPLVSIGMTGWLRMVLIWLSLKSALLDRLESFPIRFAFDRLRGLGWKEMLSQSGLAERWRDMGRTNEAIRHLSNNPEIAALLRAAPEARKGALQARRSLRRDARNLVDLRRGRAPSQRPCKVVLPGDDVSASALELQLMRELELDYAHFGEALLSAVLIPHWNKRRMGFIEPEHKENDPAYTAGDPEHILLAEEFIAYRYLALIRAVLVNLRYLMGFVSAAFVLGIVAWNSYPFQPRAGMDWVFTGLLIVLGSGVVVVFAQMHRSPILARITNTGGHHLGLAFFGRLATLGAIPVLTWLTYEFPEIGSMVQKVIQPGLSALK